jgi:ParB/RepB/Spo0J family partition protein
MFNLEFKVAPDGTVTCPAGQIIYCRPEQLRLHPDNMRRFYPAADVAEMAGSIRAATGVHLSLLVVPDPEAAGKYLVVDGNMRLAGARALGAACPPLKCEVIAADRARQLIVMAATSRYHYPKDPVSEALHYRRLTDEEGYSANEIARQTGISSATVHARLKLLELDSEILELIEQKRLPADKHSVDALLGIADPTVRIALAQRLAGVPGMTAKGIQAAAGRAAELSGKVTRPSRRKPPSAKIDKNFVLALAGQMVAHFRTDIRLLETAALSLPPDECELAEELHGRAETLRRVIGVVPVKPLPAGSGRKARRG